MNEDTHWHMLARIGTLPTKYERVVDPCTATRRVERYIAVHVETSLNVGLSDVVVM